MIVRDDLLDVEAIATSTRLSTRTVRRRLSAVACDVATRRRLYRVDAGVVALLSSIRRRVTRST